MYDHRPSLRYLTSIGTDRQENVLATMGASTASLLVLRQRPSDLVLLTPRNGDRMPPMLGTRNAVASLVLLLAAASSSGCGGQRASESPTTTGDTTTVEINPTSGRIVSLAIAPESLNVDKVGGRNGALGPDGIRDLAFDLEVFGPLTAIYILSTDEHGEPDGVFRVNTLASDSEAVSSLGGLLEKGRFSPGLGLFEGGKILNKNDGSLGELPSGRHILKAYTANSGSLRQGMRIRAFGELPDRSLVKGPIAIVP